MTNNPSHTVRRRVGLTIVGTAAAAGLALAAGPSAIADPSTVVLPEVPIPSGAEINPESLGIAPFFTGEAFEQNGSFTNLFGETIDTTASYYVGGPMQIDEYTFPVGNSPVEAIQVTDPGGAYGVQGSGLDGTVDGSTFSAVLAPTAGFYDVYEDTPYYASATAQMTDNLNEAVLFDPTGDPLVSLSGVEFGIQYLDMPDAFANGALAPIDEINVLGAGGEILMSIPVTGDLASLF